MSEHSNYCDHPINACLFEKELAEARELRSLCEFLVKARWDYERENVVREISALLSKKALAQ